MWRIVEHYVAEGVQGLDLSGLAAFEAFLEANGDAAAAVKEVVCDMSPAFLAAVAREFPEADVTVDWFHVVQLFNRAVDEVRKAERKQVRMPAAALWAVLKAHDSGKLTDRQATAPRLRGDRPRRARSRRLPHRQSLADQGEAPPGAPRRDPASRPLAALPLPPPRPRTNRLRPPVRSRHQGSGHGRKAPAPHSRTLDLNPQQRPHGGAMNGLLQAARARARSYRDTATFITMIYLIAAPLGNLFNSI